MSTTVPGVGAGQMTLRILALGPQPRSSGQRADRLQLRPARHRLLFGAPVGVSLVSITGGTDASNTGMVSHLACNPKDYPNGPTTWYNCVQPTSSVSMADRDVPPGQPDQTFGSPHSGVNVVLFADGTFVRSIISGSRPISRPGTGRTRLPFSSLDGRSSHERETHTVLRLCACLLVCQPSDLVVGVGRAPERSPGSESPASE